MTKINNSQHQIQLFEHKPQIVEINNEQQDYVRPVIVVDEYNQSLAEMRAVHDGIDYEGLMRYELETSYKTKKGKHCKGKGKGKCDDDKKLNLEAQLMAILEEQQAETIIQNREIAKEEIKQEAIKQDQINSEVIKTDVRKAEIKTNERKDKEIAQHNLLEHTEINILKKT